MIQKYILHFLQQIHLYFYSELKINFIIWRFLYYINFLQSNKMQKQIKKIPQLDPTQIVRAFQILANHNNSKQLIKSADKYISECESNPQFSLMLIKIVSQLQNVQTKWQVLIHLKNVIKRNWTTKRRANQATIMTLHIKQQIKQQLLVLYKSNWKLHYKDFNEIFKYLARQDFPANYPLLNKFVNQVLTSIAQFNIQQILNSKQLLPYLSLVKAIYKQYAQRRMLHSQDNYNKYLSQPIRISVCILQKISAALEMLKKQNQIQISLAKQLFECSRKIDKIILYSLQSMVSSMQYNQTVIQIVKYEVSKIQSLLQFKTLPNLSQEIDKNMLAILEGISKIQTLFPLLFSSFLSQYLQLILSLLINYTFQNQKLTNCIIKANTNPFNTFSYYATKQQFKQSLQYRKDSNSQINQSSQQHCHNIFISFYNSTNIMSYLEKIVGQLMTKYQRLNEDDQIMFEDAENTAEGSHQQGSFQLLISLIKAIMNRFKYQSKMFIAKLIQHLTNINNNSNIKILMNMYEIILLLPRLYDQQDIDIAKIYNLMQKCYSLQNYDLFCRLIRNYHQYFKQQTIIKCFNILIQIISKQYIEHHTIYQCIVCIRKFLLSYQQTNIQLPLQKIGTCLTKIFNLIQIYKDIPSHLWNLLNLIVQILKQLNTQIIMINLQYIVNCINVLLNIKNNNNSLIVPALAQLLTTLSLLINANDTNYMYQKLLLYNVSIKLIQTANNNNNNEEYESINNAKYQLWLAIMKNISIQYCTQQLKQKLLSLLYTHKQSILQQDPSLFMQILQQYILSRILHINTQDILKLYNQQLKDIQPQNDIRINISYFSLYYTYILLTNTFIPQLLIITINKLIYLHGKVSPSINTYRMLLMLIINYHVIIYGGDKIFEMFNTIYGNNYKEWFWPYIWSLEYINNKYTNKVITIAILKSFGILKNVITQQIQDNLPVDHILKFITLYTDPIKTQQAINGYLSSLKLFTHSEITKTKLKLNKSGQKVYSRKVVLHVNSSWAEIDLRQVYRQEISQLFKQWDWGVDDLEERYTSNIVFKITQLLNPPNNTNL